MEIKQNFFKGINRAISRSEFFDPDFFWSTQNARILQTGNLGEVVRIKGFTKISNELDNLSILYDIIRFGDHFLTFYKNTSNNFVVKIFDDELDLVSTFQYSDFDTDKGQLKQHDDTVFIAPHNKIIYKKEGSYFLRDFISNIPVIQTATTTQLAAKAQYSLSVNSSLPSGFTGEKAFAEIRVLQYNIPTNVEDSFKIVIGSDTSGLVGPFSNLGVSDFIDLIVAVINTDPVFTNKWTARRIENVIRIERVQVGSQYNDVTVNIIESNFIGVNRLRRIDGSGDGQIQITPTLLLVTDTRGGIDSNTIYGSATITIKDAIVTQPIQITNNDTPTQIATKFQTILEASDKVTNQYDVSRSGSTITIEAKVGGREYNTNLSITVNQGAGKLINLPSNFVSLTQTREGRDSSTTGTIKPNTKYWYKARYRFVDGHLTHTCSPILVDSGSVDPINVVFNVAGILDLDGTLPRLQVYRKEDNKEFFLIEEINLNNETIQSNQFIYVDDGLSNIEPLREEINIWTKSHQAQEVIDNKLVKGNLEYFDETNNISSNQFNFSLVAAGARDRDIAPYNSKLTMYVRPQYTDGTFGFFNRLNEVLIQDTNEKIRVQQTSLVTNPDKSVSKLNFYGRYLPFGEKQNVRFTSPEMITNNLGSIEDPLLFSTVTKILFGYKYVLTLGNSAGSGILTRIDGWSEGEIDFKVLGTLGTQSASISNNILTMTIHGEDFKYIPVAKYGNQTIWKLEIFEALKEAVSTGSLKLQLKSPRESGLSSVIDDDILTEQEVLVTGIQDTSIGSRTFNVEELIHQRFFAQAKIKVLMPPADNRIYLILEKSKLDEIDNPQINNYTYLGKQEQLTEQFHVIDVAEVGNVAFELLNFEKKDNAVFNVSNTALQYGDDDQFDIITGIQDAKYSLINRILTFEDNAIFLGAKANSVDGSPVVLDTTGFQHKRRSNIFYSVLASYNIYDTLILASSFNFNRTTFQNQLIWSSPLLEANYFSGGRNFSVVSFYNLPSENGEILDIISLGGNLYVFCERGVARLLVGETLTQQKSGNVFVDSSNFITKHIWIQENLNPIKQNSLIKAHNKIFYTTGEDVYEISDGIKNISLGVLNLDPSKNYFGTYVPSKNEYRLSDGTGTFVYNTKYEQWYGPFTYNPIKTIEIDNQIVSYINGLMQEDDGNTFNGTPYTTLIQSVGNDTEIGYFMKLYRKFYVNGDNLDTATLKYGKDYTELETKAFNEDYLKNGDYNFGIKNEEGNTQKIFWEIESQKEDFSLKGFKTLYSIRRRR